MPLVTVRTGQSLTTVKERCHYGVIEVKSLGGAVTTQVLPYVGITRDQTKAVMLHK